MTLGGQRGDEAQFVTLLGRNVARGQHHAHRALHANGARQPVHTTGKRCQAYFRLGQREFGVLGRDDDVAGQRGLETTAHRHAIDGSDDRLVKPLARRQARKARRHEAACTATGLVLEVVAGRKRSRSSAGDDRDPLLGVGSEIVPHAFEFEVRRVVQRVHHVWAVQRDDGQVAFAFDLAEFMHRSLLG